MRSNDAKTLVRKWSIPAQQAYYHHAGTFFMPLQTFPGALCDANGFVLFQSHADFARSQDISIGRRANVRKGISNLAGYVRMA